MSSKQEITYERSTAGLRDALFGEMEDLKSGAAAPHEALAFSKLAAQIISSVELDLRHLEIDLRQEDHKIRARELTLREREVAVQESSDRALIEDCNNRNGDSVDMLEAAE